MKRLLVDSCIWYAIWDKTDDKHSYCEVIERTISTHQLIIPYPILYETLNSRFVGNRYKQCENFFKVLNSTGKVTFVPDGKYRENALRILNASSDSYQQYSLVDMIIRLMMEDMSLGSLSVYSFNIKDFLGVNSVEVCSPVNQADCC